ALPFNGFHRSHLRKRDIPTSRNCPQGVFHSFDFGFPDWFPEPNGKSINFKAPPARGEEMAQLMDKNQQVEQQQHFQDDKDDFQNRHTISPTTPKFGTLEYNSRFS